MIEIPILIDLLLNYGLPQDKLFEMVCIAYEESKFDSKAVNHSNSNGTIDYGLYQINSIWIEELNLSIPKIMNLHANVKAAVFIYKKQGITAWATHKRCING